MANASTIDSAYRLMGGSQLTTVGTFELRTIAPMPQTICTCFRCIPGAWDDPTWTGFKFWSYILTPDFLLKIRFIPDPQQIFSNKSEP